RMARAGEIRAAMMCAKPCRGARFQRGTRTKNSLSIADGRGAEHPIKGVLYGKILEVWRKDFEQSSSSEPTLSKRLTERIHEARESYLGALKSSGRK
ncbi:hypothetical protein, partial [Klebsiella pneumoniae]|uniref:hypothetical protein n=1 Tax=Klebsiella pneumoniae TaxID=573 RepID=UPI001C4E1909